MLASAAWSVAQPWRMVQPWSPGSTACDWSSSQPKPVGVQPAHHGSRQPENGAAQTLQHACLEMGAHISRSRGGHPCCALLHISLSSTCPVCAAPDEADPARPRARHLPEAAGKPSFVVAGLAAVGLLACCRLHISGCVLRGAHALAVFAAAASARMMPGQCNGACLPRFAGAPALPP